MGPSLSAVLEKAVAATSSRADTVSDPNGIWIHVAFPGVAPAERGWKLHVSATPWNAHRVLEVSLPVLIERRVPFKIAASIERVIELNEGIGGVRQAGKFITIYPPTADDAVAVALDLDRRTAGERGPRVIGDRALSPVSLVHYRYADFVEDAPPGEAPVPEDPFVAAGVVDDRAKHIMGSRYLITATLHSSLRGAVHLAVDTKEKRSCVLKRAWRDALLTPDGRDARDRLRDEAEILGRLHEDPHFPDVFDVFEDDADLFVAMEHVEGTPLARAVANDAYRATPSAFGLEMGRALQAMHRIGFVHRDLNPVNVLVDEGLYLIDLELARAVGTPAAGYGAGTEGYVSPNQRRGGPASVADDLFGLGCLMYFVATGSDPAPTATASETAEALRGHDAALAEVVEGLLDPRGPRWQSIDEVLGMLASATDLS